jgi:putative DNA primase/helicase
VTVGEGPGVSSAEADLRTLLAELGELEYERQREELGARFGMRVSVLDRLHRDERKTHPRESGLELWTPEAWPDEVDGAEVLDDLAAAVRRFVVLDDAARDAAALWTMHAHAHDAAAISPILLITAPARGCGKSTLLDVVGRVVPRPLTSAASTAAALYRTAEQRPTILCDEGDAYLGDDRRLVAFFNAGHRRGVPFRVCEGDENRVRAYPSWAPKAIAMIGLPRDATIADRSIRCALQRKTPADAAEDFSSTKPYPELRDLARRCARWVTDHLDELRDADPVLPDGFANRLADNWRALLAIADAAGGEWPHRARAAAVAVGELPDSDLGTMLLADLRDVFGTAGALYTEAVVEGLLALPERPWRGVRKGRGVDAAWVARTLAPFGIRSERIRNGDDRRRGYLRAALEPAWSRYLPADTHPSALVEAVPSVPASREPAAVGHRDGWDGPDEGARGYTDDGSLGGLF